MVYIIIGIKEDLARKLLKYPASYTVDEVHYVMGKVIKSLMTFDLDKIAEGARPPTPNQLRRAEMEKEVAEREEREVGQIYIDYGYPGFVGKFRCPECDTWSIFDARGAHPDRMNVCCTGCGHQFHMKEPTKKQPVKKKKTPVRRRDSEGSRHKKSRRKTAGEIPAGY